MLCHLSIKVPMHELPITQNILKIALRYGETSKASRITDLYLVIGQLTSIIDDSIQFYWPIISEGTIAENAPIIPISAQRGLNTDVLLNAIEEIIPTPERDET